MQSLQLHPNHHKSHAQIWYNHISWPSAVLETSSKTSRNSLQNFSGSDCSNWSLLLLTHSINVTRLHLQWRVGEKRREKSESEREKQVGNWVRFLFHYLLSLQNMFESTVGPRFTGPRFTGTPIYRDNKFPPIPEINGIWPRYTGHPDLPGKTLSPEHPGKSGSDCNDFPSNQGSEYILMVLEAFENTWSELF